MCIQYLCSKCGVHFVGEDAILRCTSYYFTPSNCPSDKISYAKREEGQHPNNQPCSGPTPSTQSGTERVPRKRTAAPVKTDTNYARPGDLFNEETWRRVADVVRKTRVGEEIASVTRAMEAKNNDANGCFKDRLKEDELFRGRGVVRRETAIVEAKEDAACALGGGNGGKTISGTGEVTDEEGRKK